MSLMTRENGSLASRGAEPTIQVPSGDDRPTPMSTDTTTGKNDVATLSDKIVRTERRGGLAYYWYADDSNPRVALMECPACGHEFKIKEKRAVHLHRDHRPEDFGLTPFGGGDT